MSIIISSNYVITDTASGGGTITGDNPVIGYRNIVTTSNISSTSEETGFPVTNLANPSTNLRWQGVDGVEDEYISINNADVEDIDYIAIAKHNLGSEQIPISIEYQDTSMSPDWDELVQDVLLADDGPALFRLPEAAYTGLRIRLQPGNAAPRIAVLYVGELLVLQRRIYVGHTPITYGRQTKVINARSESGNFLGRIVTGQKTMTAVQMKNLTPDWYRANMEPFFLVAQETPFFFAWRPESYPNEVGYGWLTNDPQPKNQLPNGMMEIEFQMSGVV